MSSLFYHAFSILSIVWAYKLRHQKKDSVPATVFHFRFGIDVQLYLLGPVTSQKTHTHTHILYVTKVLSGDGHKIDVKMDGHLIPHDCSKIKYETPIPSILCFNFKLKYNETRGSCDLILYI